MKDYLPEVIRGRTGPEARNRVREYLQARILASLQRSGAMIPLAFHGGTALRFLYSLQRYSEDLDFALERVEAQYDFRGYLDRIVSDLRREGYDVGVVRLNDRKAVHSASVRFPGLLHALKLSGHRDEALSVRLEVDTHPPAGAGLATTVVRRHVILRLQHHDRASLLSGKLHAVLQRPYPKGRDFYDLLWYLADRDWPAPNLVMLNHALKQTGWGGRPLRPTTWRAAVGERVRKLAWDAVGADVRPLLEVAEEREMLNRKVLLDLLRGPGRRSSA